MKNRFKKLIKIIAEGCYHSDLNENTEFSFNIIFKVILRKNDSHKFQVIKRWAAENTFAWFDSNRRLSKYFEVLINISENMIRL